MKNLEIELMSQQELENTDGGLFFLVMAGFGACAWAFSHGYSVGQSLGGI